MVGGLILSQALTLYTTPVVFLYLDRVNKWLQNLGQTRDTAVSSSPEHAPIG
jgi:HAE1 family hydrophobic/amphiphilic exporter-1